MAVLASVEGWEPTGASSGTALVRQPDVAAPRPRLLDRVRTAIRVRQYSPRTEKAYARRVVRFVRFHADRHPKEVLGRNLSRFDAIVGARRPVRLPVVLSREEVAGVLGRLRGTPWLMASLLYGCGLRLVECCQLRVKDVDLGHRQIRVRGGRGRKDRVTVLPASLVSALTAHLARVRHQHEEDVRSGAGSVALPDALRRKYPNARHQRMRSASTG